MPLISKFKRAAGDPRVVRSGPGSRSMTDRMARGLGWFSIGLGITELLAAKQMTKLMGMQGSESLVRAFGVREITSGILTLTPEKQFGLWSRVIGDGIDIAVLMKAMSASNRKRENVGIALAMVMGVAALDVIGAKGASKRHSRNVGERRSYKDRSGFPKGVQAAQSRSRKSRGASNATIAAAGTRRSRGEGVRLH